jgi:hypothetical protein
MIDAELSASGATSVALKPEVLSPTPAEVITADIEFSVQELAQFKANLTQSFEVLNADMKGLATNEAMACQKVHTLLIAEQSSELQSMVVETFAVITTEFIADTFQSGQKVVQFEELSKEQKKVLTDKWTTLAVEIVNAVQLDT